MGNPEEQPKYVNLRQLRFFMQKKKTPLAIQVMTKREFLGKPGDPNFLKNLREGYTAEFSAVIAPGAVGKFSRNASELGPQRKEILNECIAVVQNIRSRSGRIMRLLSKPPKKPLKKQMGKFLLSPIKSFAEHSSLRDLLKEVPVLLYALEMMIVDIRLQVGAILYTDALYQEQPLSEMLEGIRNKMKEQLQPALQFLEHLETRLEIPPSS